MDRNEETIQPISEHLMINSRHADDGISGNRADHEAPLPSLPNLPRRVAPRAILRDTRSAILKQDEEVCADAMSAPIKARTARRRFYPRAGHLEERGRDPTLSQQSEETIAKSEALTDSEAKSFFNGIALKTPCVFLCLGPPENCRIVQVHVTENDRDEKVFQAMKESWSKNRKWMPFRKVTGVQEVTVSGS